MYRIAISDDNKSHLSELRRHVIEILGDKIQNISEFYSAMDIEDYIDKCGFSFDIVLMDIKYDDEEHNGIELAKLIHSISPACQIIFVTSFLKFATDIFDSEHTYFVIKTELSKRLPLALQKAESNLENLRSSKLYISNKGIDYVLNTNDILYIERIRRTTQIVVNDNIYTCSEPLETLLQRMNQEIFIQTHKSYAVNMSKIRNLCRNTLTLNNHKIIPISRAHWKTTHDKFMIYLGNLI